MAEKKGVGHAYNVDFLNVVFAASRLFLFLSVVWMVWDDYDREWKNTQRQFANLEYQVTQAQLQAAGRGVDRNKLTQLESQQKAAEQNVAANRAKVDELEAKLKDADTRLYRATLDFQYAKATYDQDRYDFEASRANGDSSAAKKGQNVEELGRRLNDLNLAREKAEADKAAAAKVEAAKVADAKVADGGREHGEGRHIHRRVAAECRGSRESTRQRVLANLERSRGSIDDK